MAKAWYAGMAFCLGIILYACTKEVPTAPKAEFQENSDTIYLLTGTDAVIHILFSDSVELSQFKVSMGFAPGELSIDTSRTGMIWIEWKYLLIGEKKDAQFDTAITLTPTGLLQPGKYRIIAAALNHDFQERSDTIWLVLKNPADTVNPSAVIDTPLPNSAYVNNDTIRITGLMNDLASDGSPSGVYRVEILLRNIAGINATSIYSASRVKKDSLDVQYTVSSGLPDGGYNLVLRMTDGYNNTDSVLVPVIIQ